ncbi:MAG: VWA domain-containing protein [Acidobacteria bacterium]|nr:VWA domain-containing protein [Acidobacteriota bacterium]
MSRPLQPNGTERLPACRRRSSAAPGLLVILCVLLPGISLRARISQQDNGAAGNDLTYTVRSQLVQIFMTVTESNQTVTNLQASDLYVLENGVPMPIERLDSGEVPLQVVLLLDTSGSMRDSLSVIQEAAAYFVDSLRPSDRITLVLFNNSIRTIPQFTDDRGPLLQAIRTARAQGGTKLYEALLYAMKHLEDKKGRKAIVSFSDGDDTAHTASLRLVLNAAARYGYPIYTIGAGAGLRSDALKTVLQQLAAVNAGKAYFKEDPKQLRGSFEDVSSELRSAYVLNYYTQVPPDGRWHDVSIQASRPNLKIQCRRGFFARGGSFGEDWFEKSGRAATHPADPLPSPEEPREVRSEAAAEILRAPLPERDLDAESLRAALPPDPQTRSGPTRPVFRVESRLVEVPLIVESTSGKELPALSEKDFRIYEDDSLREISFFSRVTGSQSAADLREAATLKMRSDNATSTASKPATADLPLGMMFLVLDDLMTEASSFLRAKEAAETIIRENHHPLRPVALHFSSRSSAPVNPTETAEEMIQKVRRAGVRSSSPLTGNDDIMTIYEAYLVERNEPQAVQLAELRQAALMQVSFSNSLGAVYGQVEGNPEVIRNEVHNTALRLISENSAQLSRALDGLVAIVGAASAKQGEIPTTVLFVSSGFSVGRSSGRADFSQRLEKIVTTAKRNGVRFFTIDASGLSVRDSIGLSTNTRFLANNPHLQALLERHSVEWESDRQSPLFQLAKETGGRFIHSTNDLASVARVAVRMAGDLYYLAYVSRQPADGRFHRIRVSSSVPAARIQARKGYYAGRYAAAAPGSEAGTEEDWEALLERARQARQSGDLAAAAASLEKLTRRFPNEISLWYNLGAVQLAMGNGAGAADSFQSALAIAPGDKVIGAALARALLAAGFVNAATDTMESIIRSHPGDADLLMQLGRIYEADGDPLKAYQTYRRILDLTAAPPLDAYLLLVRTGLDLGREVEARIFIGDYAARGGDPAAMEALRNRLARVSSQ